MYVYIWSTQRNSGEHLQGCSTAPLHNSKYVNKTRTSVHGALCVCVSVYACILYLLLASICQIIKINTTLNRFRTYMVRTWSDELRVCCSVYAYILLKNKYISSAKARAFLMPLDLLRQNRSPIHDTASHINIVQISVAIVRWSCAKLRIQ